MTSVSAGPAVLIRPAHAHESEEIARYHRAYLGPDIFSGLGLGFTAALYRHFCMSPDAFGFVAYQKDTLCGFIFGTADTIRVYRRIALRYWYIYAYHLLKTLVRPALFLQAVRPVFFPLALKSRVCRSEILFFCVKPQARRNKVGTMLYEALRDEFRNRRVSLIRACAYEDNSAARAFYLRQGFRLQESAVHHGKVLNLYCKDS